MVKKEKIKMIKLTFLLSGNDIWKRFCEEHATLFNLTCDEYTHLLKTDMDKLEETIDKKSKTIDRINVLDNLRSEIIDELNIHLKNNDEVKQYKIEKDQ